MAERKSIGAAVLAAVAAWMCMLSLSACRMSEEDAACYEEVLALALDEVGDDDWVPTGWCCGWSSHEGFAQTMI